MNQVRIDLNADLGEQINTELDAHIMPYISSCNIACGGHSGNESSIEETLQLAKRSGVSVGAHPSYPDPEFFGRRVLDISDDDLLVSLIKQIKKVNNACERSGLDMHHVKPHGALYNYAAKNQAIASLICKAITEVNRNVKLYGSYGSEMEIAAERSGLAYVTEGFADRKYEDSHTLLSRAAVGAVLTNVSEVLHQVEQMAFNQRIKTLKNGWQKIKVHTICLHSDTPGAVTLAKKIREHLETRGAQVTSN
ncbi:MAG: 5-oxoprolinase subunit PxpA [Bacteroidota bacterium]